MIQRNWRDLIKPRKLEVDSDSLTPSYGKFIAEPLERGYGQTLGNALRRVLLSSLQGAAVTHVEFAGVLHEFSTVPGVVEDATEIVLNIKELAFRLHSDEPVEIAFDVKGPGKFTGADLEGGANVEVVNTGAHIATLGKDARMKGRMIVQMGRGFVAADQNKREGDPIGILAVDSIFSPIRKVNFTVGHARVGQRTDYDKLELEVWTNGTISPEDAVAIAARILQDQLSTFINFDVEEDEQDALPAETTMLGAGKVASIFLKPLEELELSVRAINSLKGANIHLLGDMAQMKEKDLKSLKNLGQKSLDEIKALLSDMDLTLGMKIENWETIRPPLPQPEIPAE